LLKGIDLADLLRPEAVAEVRSRLQHTAPTAQARTAEELAHLIQEAGDLATREIALRATVDPSGWIGQLAGAQRIVQMEIPTAHGPENRWVAAEYAEEYKTAFMAVGQADSLSYPPDEARRRILERFLSHTGPVTREAILARYAFPVDWLQAELDRQVEKRQLAHGRFTPTAAPATAEYVDRHTLEQMHRRTLTLLRREVRPVPFTAYADFLARWQHLHPDERLKGSGALRQTLQQLRAAPVVGRIWERDVLPLRLDHYQTQALAALCQSGELIWVGSGGIDPRRGRIRFLFRGEGSVYLEPAPTDLTTLSAEAQTVYSFLKSEGAVFLADIRAGLSLAETDAERALLELAMAGLVTNDSLAALQRIIQGGTPRPPTPPRPYSSLEAQLAERMGSRLERHGSVRQPSRSEMQAARRRIRNRLEQESEVALPTPQEGRWTLVHRFGILGKPLPLAEQVAQQARQLLARYGVVTHESLENEIGAWDWSLIYQELQRLELRGEVRRGYFVQGLAGVQFALPEVVERLRAETLTNDESATDALVLMNACDPANLYGPAAADGPQTITGEPLTFARIPSTWLVQQRGLPALLLEDTGAQLTTVQGADEGLVRRAIQRWLAHLATFEHRVTVTQWNGSPVLNSPGQPLLESLGFYRDYPGMTWG